ncbi:unnamed protein product [Polarella glacialis]|uniref:TOG domain-containing protein n=1 Tax=Polarella glacialis TaxID=89957 RepID=A0A813GM09_POLGL|nr:unnamed protein product [Polarella glacialis]
MAANLRNLTEDLAGLGWEAFLAGPAVAQLRASCQAGRDAAGRRFNLAELLAAGLRSPESSSAAAGDVGVASVTGMVALFGADLQPCRSSLRVEDAAMLLWWLLWLSDWRTRIGEFGRPALPPCQRPQAGGSEQRPQRLRPGGGDSESATSALTSALTDRVPDVRRAALSALIEVASPRDYAAVAQAVTARLVDGDSYVRLAALAAVGRLAEAGTRVSARGSQATAWGPAVAARLRRDPDEEVRVSALGCLLRLAEPGDRRVLAELLASCSKDASSVVRHTALDALPKFAAVSGSAQRPLQSVAPVLSALLKDDPDPEVRRAAARAASQIGDSTVAAAALLVLDDRDAGVRGAVIAALAALHSRSAGGGSMAKAAAATLTLNRLAESCPEVRCAAAAALGSLASQGDSAVVSALVARLRDRSDVAEAAAAALAVVAKRGDDFVKSALLARLQDARDWRLRCAAVSALGAGIALPGDASVLEALILCLGDCQAEVRAAAAGSLGAVAQRGDATVLAALLAQLPVMGP